MKRVGKGADRLEEVKAQRDTYWHELERGRAAAMKMMAYLPHPDDITLEEAIDVREFMRWTAGLAPLPEAMQYVRDERQARVEKVLHNANAKLAQAQASAKREGE